MNEAELYNTTKNIAFSILLKDGTEAVYKFLSSKYQNFPANMWYGLKAEIDFFIGYKYKYKLDPTLDYGIKCDFVGNIDGCNNCRIDVTTNYSYKKLKDYEAVQKRDNRFYKIVLMNKNTGKLEDVFDLNFPIDNSGGRLLDIALFMPMDYNSQGDPRYNYYQRILTISSSTNCVIEEKSIVTDWYLTDIITKIDEFNSYDEVYADNTEKDLLNKYLENSAKLLSKTTNLNIVACGQTCNEIIDPRTCETDEITKLFWKHPVIQDLLDDTIYDLF